MKTKTRFLHVHKTQKKTINIFSVVKTYVYSSNTI